MSNHMPFGLDDDQLDQIMTHAAPLQPSDRRPFVEAVTRALDGVEPGPGAIARACAAAQRVFLDRATGGRARAAPKHLRPYRASTRLPQGRKHR